MSDIRKHKATQEAFAAHIRNPSKYPIPEGIEEQRMQIYRDLFFNNINGLIKQAFPILKSLYPTEEWIDLIRDFYQKEHNKTPYFTEISTEFLQFLNQRPMDVNRPFIQELAHYEWLEMALEKDKNKPLYQAVDTQQLCDQIPMITPLIKIQSYQYPVHQIGPKYQPIESKGNNHLMVWRNRKQQIKFACLNKISTLLMTQLQLHKYSGQQALLNVFTDNHIDITEQTMAFGHQQLFKWHQQDIIINTQKRT